MAKDKVVSKHPGSCLSIQVLTMLRVIFAELTEAKPTIHSTMALPFYPVCLQCANNALGGHSDRLLRPECDSAAEPPQSTVSMREA